MNRFWGLLVPFILISCSKKQSEFNDFGNYDLKYQEYYFNVKTKKYTNNPNDEWHLKFIATNLEVDFDLGDGFVLGSVPNPTILLNENVKASLDGINYKNDEYVRALDKIYLDSIYIFKTRNRKFIKVKFISFSDSVKAVVNDSINFSFPIGSYVDLENLKYKNNTYYRDSTWDVYINGQNDVKLNIWGIGKFPVKVGKDTIDIYIKETLPSGIDIFRLKGENEDNDSFKTDYYNSLIGDEWWSDYNLSVHTFVSKSLIYYLKLPDSSVYRVRITEYNKGFVLVEVL